MRLVAPGGRADERSHIGVCPSHGARPETRAADTGARSRVWTCCIECYLEFMSLANGWRLGSFEGHTVALYKLNLFIALYPLAFRGAYPHSGINAVFC